MVDMSTACIWVHVYICVVGGILTAGLPMHCQRKRTHQDQTTMRKRIQDPILVEDDLFCCCLLEADTGVWNRRK